MLHAQSARAAVTLFRDRGGEDFGRAFGDENVVLDANAAELQVLIHPGPIDLAGKTGAPVGRIEERGDEIQAGFDRDDVTGPKWQVNPQRTEAGSGVARSSGFQAARVPDAEP